MDAAKALQAIYRPALHQSSPFYGFLLPSLSHLPRSSIRCVSTSTPKAPASAPAPSASELLEKPTPAKRRHPLSKLQQEFLDSALRVNHAGELAATLIYSAQTPPILKSHPHLRPLMHHMYTQEAGHFSTFSSLLAKHRIRPTAMYPVWTAAAMVLGWGTAVLGREAAMACTEAVETEIGGHYNGQVRVLLQWMREMEERGEEVGDEIRELVGTLKRIRDEELEHLDEAVEQDAKKAGGYTLLNRVVRSGCKGAIWISERI